MLLSYVDDELVLLVSVTGCEWFQDACGTLYERVTCSLSHLLFVYWRFLRSQCVSGVSGASGVTFSLSHLLFGSIGVHNERLGRLACVWRSQWASGASGMLRQASRKASNIYANMSKPKDYCFGSQLITTWKEVLFEVAN